MNNFNGTEIKHMQTHMFSEKIIDLCKELEVGDLNKYNSDKSIYYFHSLCLIKIQNADLIIMSKGDDFYYEHLLCVIKDVYNFFEVKNYTSKLFVYYLDNETFAIVPKDFISDDEFIHITKKLNKNFQFVKPKTNDAPLLLRFSTVTQKENPLASALLLIENSQYVQTPYLLSDEKTEEADKNEEMVAIDVLSWAIKNNGIIPYYQGIYDNKKQCIEKYEALMRIKGEDGTLYLPSYFLDISKKYHLYTTLNNIMLRQVIADVDKYGFATSVNISVHDINSDYFRENIYNILSGRKSKQLFVIELLEDEPFKDMTILKDFIKNISIFNVKIAIDDFGSGFSNLFQIGEINPHFIKIDGNIIKNIVGSTINQSIILAVKMLANQLDAHLVAEYVESEEIQNCILELGIEFSQGFYFAKPEPIENIFKN